MSGGPTPEFGLTEPRDAFDSTTKDWAIAPQGNPSQAHATLCFHGSMNSMFWEKLRHFSEENKHL